MRPRPTLITKNRTTTVFLLGLIAVALYLCYVLISPFLKPVAFSAILAILFFPMHSRIRRRIRNRTASALISTVVVILLTALSASFLGRAIATGLRDIYQSLAGSADGRERLGLYLVNLFEKTVELLDRYLPIPVADLQGAIVNQAERWVAALLNMTAGAIGSVALLIANTFIAFFVLFFLFRDGKGMLRRAFVLLPLTKDQARRLFARVKDTLNAIVFGTLAMAAFQGALTGLAFWIVGVTSPVLWAIVTALCALLPVIGTAFVLFPAISMLAFSGHWMKAVILLVWGLAIVHPVDNVLRPYLIGDRIKVSTLYVFFAVLGGLKVLGPLGLFLGPLILAVTVALFTFLREEKRAGIGDWWLNNRSETEIRQPRESRLASLQSHISH
ncbi:MAG TPA: AI-2E family transporter [Candidatus Acidoferrum sp.]|nr:AI-2E family transporter [Candidatus Acidoferrum sp.]